jgi:hypothetical protein
MRVTRERARLDGFAALLMGANEQSDTRHLTVSSRATLSERQGAAGRPYRSRSGGVVGIALYRIIWHIRPPYVARASHLMSSRGVLCQRGTYMRNFE